MKSDTEQEQLVPLPEDQDHVVSRAQALKSGLSRHAIAHRLRPGGPWRRLLPGVYLTVSGKPTQAQKEMAALLFAGPGSVITGAAALRHYKLHAPKEDSIDVLVGEKVQRRSTDFVRLHRTTRLPEIVQGEPPWRYAFPARAAADAARLLTDLTEARAVIADAVQNRNGCAVGAIEAELEKGPIRHSHLLRSVLAEVSDGVRSAPEAELRDLIEGSDLPTPMYNARLYLPNGTLLGIADVWWPEAGLAVEVDSRQWHLSPADWERTMKRHAAFGEHAIVTLHFSPNKIRRDQASLVTSMRNAYAAGIARPRPAITTIPATPDLPVVPATGPVPTRVPPSQPRRERQ